MRAQHEDVVASLGRETGGEDGRDRASTNVGDVLDVEGAGEVIGVDHELEDPDGR